jgi:hypothetical protein
MLHKKISTSEKLDHIGIQMKHIRWFLNLILLSKSWQLISSEVENFAYMLHNIYAVPRWPDVGSLNVLYSGVRRVTSRGITKGSVWENLLVTSSVVYRFMITYLGPTDTTRKLGYSAVSAATYVVVVGVLCWESSVVWSPTVCGLSVPERFFLRCRGGICDRRTLLPASLSRFAHILVQWALVIVMRNILACCPGAGMRLVSIAMHPLGYRQAFPHREKQGLDCWWVQLGCRSGLFHVPNSIPIVLLVVAGFWEVLLSLILWECTGPNILSCPKGVVFLSCRSVWAFAWLLEPSQSLGAALLPI